MQRLPPESVCEGARAFRAWRDEHKISQARACALLKINHLRSCHEWEWGAKLPSLPLAIRIEEITQGRVTVEMWGYAEGDIAPMIAFGVRRARLSGLVPRGTVIFGGRPA